MSTGYIAVAEGVADAYALKPAAGASSVAASSFPCQVGQASCPRLGFGHGNRVETVLWFNLSAIPQSALVDSAVLSLRETEGLDYDQELGLAPIASTVPFGQLTWVMCRLSRGSGNALYALVVTSALVP